MALTREIELPNAPKQGSQWSVTRLFGSGVDGLGVVIKQHHPLEFAFLFMVVASAFLELFRSFPSWEWWVAMLFVFVGSVYERLLIPAKPEAKPKPEEKA